MVIIGKRLTFILEHYWGQRQGGAELQTHYLEHRAIRKGLNTHYCFLSNGDDIDQIHGTRIYPIAKKKIWSKFDVQYPYAFDIFQALKKIKPDVIYQRCASSFTGIASYYAQRNNCQLAFHVSSDRDVSQIPIPWKRPWLIPEYKLMQYGFRTADTIIAQTQFQAEQLKINYGRQAIVIPNGHPVPADCVKADDQITVLWIANWKSIKQPELFIRLVEEIGRDKNVHFVMLGRTDGYSGLVKLAKSHNIDVVGEVSNDRVNDYLVQGHILVNTSRQEGFSNTFIQAWMRRVPVVSYRVDPDHILQNEQIGYCFSGNFRELVQNTGALIRDSKLRNTMGAKARKYAIKHHSLENIDEILKTIIQ